MDIVLHTESDVLFISMIMNTLWVWRKCQLRTSDSVAENRWECRAARQPRQGLCSGRLALAWPMHCRRRTPYAAAVPPALRWCLWARPVCESRSSRARLQS